MRYRILSVVLLSASFGSVLKADIIFTSIAHSSDGFAGSSFADGIGVPSINNHGQIAFRGRQASGLEGIFVGDGTTLHTVADSNGPFPGFSNGVPGINDDGDVVFLTNIPSPPGNTGTRLIARGNINTPVNDVSQVLGRNDPLPGIGSRALGAGDSAPAINNNGDVSIAHKTVIGPLGVYRVGDVVTEIGPPNPSALGGTAINDAGQVAFLSGLSSSIKFGDGTALTEVINTGFGGLGFLGFDAPDLNNSGNIVFYASDGVVGGVDGFYGFDGVSVSKLFSNTIDVSFETSPFVNLFPGINNHGNIAGLASVRQSNNLFAETLFLDNPISGKIVSTGDELFGRTIQDLDFFRGINDQNQLAFYARFTDGSEGVYRADTSTSAVPEPSAATLLLLLIVVAWILTRTQISPTRSVSHLMSGSTPDRASSRSSHRRHASSR